MTQQANNAERMINPSQLGTFYVKGSELTREVQEPVAATVTTQPEPETRIPDNADDAPTPEAE